MGISFRWIITYIPLFLKYYDVNMHQPFLKIVFGRIICETNSLSNSNCFSISDCHLNRLRLIFLVNQIGFHLRGNYINDQSSNYFCEDAIN